MISRKPIEKVGLIARKNIADNATAVVFIKNLLDYLEKNNKKVLFDNNVCKIFGQESGCKKEELLKDADMVLTLGGDGTLLKTGRCVSRKRVLILGVNLGTLGFLTECTPDKAIACLDKVFADQYHIDRRSLLRATLYRDGKKIETFLALNDAVINQGAFARLISMNLEVNNRKIVSFKADGMIVATPTGSTGHSLSAGGPIVHPQIEGLIFTPICPSSLSMRSILVPDTRQLTVTIETHRRDDNASIIGLTIDGQDLIMLKYGDQIKFRRSKRYVYLVRTQNRYYKLLRTKLNWGES